MTKTALTTSLMLLSAGIASAQTTVSGNLALVYKAISLRNSFIILNSFFL